MPTPAALLLLVLLLPPPARAAESETETGARDLRLETLVAPPEGCTELSAPGDTVHIHYTGSLEDDGRIIDTSLSRDPLQVELGKRQVIPGLEQSLLDMCVGEKRRVIIPPHLAYGKRGSPPSIPGKHSPPGCPRGSPPAPLTLCAPRGRGRGAAVRGGAGGSVPCRLLAEGAEQGGAAAVPGAGAGAAGAHRVPPLPQGQQLQALQEEDEGREEEQSQKEIKPFP
uniref:peptidylprolyl isomerase n=1 Tax=Strigops habroptila TaxID=2489341 RepID=A0A672TGX6_STRHB